MATQEGLIEISRPASGDLSSYQFHIMSLDTDGKAVLAADADSTTQPPMPMILQDKPAAEDRPAKLAVAGAPKVMAGGSFNETDALTCDASGHAIATTTAGDKCIGRALTAGTSGELAEVLLGMFMYEAS